MLNIVIEDGSGVEGANSFVSLDIVKAYMLSRGFISPASDDAIKAVIVKSCDYMLSKEKYFSGDRTSEEQPLVFPRINYKINGRAAEDNTIPAYLKSAHCQVVLELLSGNDLLANFVSSNVKREKIGPIDTEYFSSKTAARLPVVDALLKPLFKSSSLITYRV
jgi:hypothetical protein